MVVNLGHQRRGEAEQREAGEMKGDGVGDHLQIAANDYSWIHILCLQGVFYFESHADFNS